MKGFNWGVKAIFVAVLTGIVVTASCTDSRQFGRVDANSISGAKARGVRLMGAWNAPEVVASYSAVDTLLPPSESFKEIVESANGTLLVKVAMNTSPGSENNYIKTPNTSGWNLSNPSIVTGTGSNTHQVYVGSHPTSAEIFSIWNTNPGFIGDGNDKYFFNRFTENQGWQTLESLPNPLGGLTLMSFLNATALSDGRFVAFWFGKDSLSNAYIVLSMWNRLTGWSPSTRIAVQKPNIGDAFVYAFDIDEDAAGNMLAVWAEPVGGGVTNVLSSSIARDGAWGPSRLVASTVGTDIFRNTLSLSDDGGRAELVIRHFSETPQQPAVVTVSLLNGVWQTPVNPNIPSSSRVVKNHRGDLAIAWWQGGLSSTAPTNIYSMQFSYSTGWSQKYIVGKPIVAEIKGLPNIAYSDTGSLAVSWVEAAAMNRLYVSHFNSIVGWDTPELVYEGTITELIGQRFENIFLKNGEYAVIWEKAYKTGSAYQVDVLYSVHRGGGTAQLEPAPPSASPLTGIGQTPSANWQKPDNLFSTPLATTTENSIVGMQVHLNKNGTTLVGYELLSVPLSPFQTPLLPAQGYVHLKTTSSGWADISPFQSSAQPAEGNVKLKLDENTDNVYALWVANTRDRTLFAAKPSSQNWLSPLDLCPAFECSFALGGNGAYIFNSTKSALTATNYVLPTNGNGGGLQQSVALPLNGKHGGVMASAGNRFIGNLHDPTTNLSPTVIFDPTQGWQSTAYAYDGNRVGSEIVNDVTTATGHRAVLRVNIDPTSGDPPLYNRKILSMDVDLFDPAIGWFNTKRIANGGNYIDRPDIAANDKGDVVITWTEALPNSIGGATHGVYYVRANIVTNALLWNSPEFVQPVNHQSESFGTKAAVSEDGRFAIVWFDATATINSLKIAKYPLANSALPTVEDVIVYDNLVGGVVTQATVDANNQYISIAWQQTVVTPSIQEIRVWAEQSLW